MTHIVFYNYDWEYWNLFHKVTFDGPNKLILVNAGVTEINVLAEIYSPWKEWIQFDDTYSFNAGYEQAFDLTGGDPLPAADDLDATFFLINGWKIKPYPGDYDLLIDGNIFSRDGSRITVPADGTNNNITITVFNSAIVRRIGTIADSIESIMIDEIHKIHGLNKTTPMVVSPTERTAGADIQQTFTEDDPVPDSITTRRT